MLQAFLILEALRLDDQQQKAEEAERNGLSSAASSAFAAGQRFQLARDREALQAIFHNECDFFGVNL